MLRAPVLMRSLRDGPGQRKPSIIKKNESAARERSRTNTNDSFYSEESTRKHSLATFVDKPGSSRSGGKLGLDKGFRVKILESSEEREGCVYYKDDEDRFTQQ